MLVTAEGEDVEEEEKKVIVVVEVLWWWKGISNRGRQGGLRSCYMLSTMAILTSLHYLLPTEWQCNNYKSTSASSSAFRHPVIYLDWRGVDLRSDPLHVLNI